MNAKYRGNIRWLIEGTKRTVVSRTEMKPIDMTIETNPDQATTLIGDWACDAWLAKNVTAYSPITTNKPAKIVVGLLSFSDTLVI